MARTDNTKTLWQVQVRLSRNHKWRSKGIYETREDARYQAGCHRDGYCDETGFHDGVGFGNTRIQRHIRGEKK